ncbi:hypothetical protein CYFUS_000201 [Cystobacter fuscus]|uniref:Uncharacterized protein n=1 Tax=Cystobacter fuscus TaxID=43 RepID=A0A250ISR6_9BACT|nr:hypothetical protein CYFUS_000201 [Cystobacter fuscus]
MSQTSARLLEVLSLLHASARTVSERAGRRPGQASGMLRPLFL